MKEVWQAVQGYEGYYEVSNTGYVRSVTRQVLHPSSGKMRTLKGKVLKGTPDSYGYKFVRLSLEGCVSTCYIHRLVAEAFIPNPEDKAQVNHQDYNRQNNSVKNLEWVTHLENLAHQHSRKITQRQFTYR